jgi:hypothetical protein
VLYTVADPITGKLRPGFTVAKRSRGSCWTGSIGSARPDAWRCVVANEIHDPCFAPAMNATTVHCPMARSRKALLAIILTKRCHLSSETTARRACPARPLRSRSPAARPAAFGVAGGIRINYACSDGRMLLGEEDRGLPRWRIYAMPRAASSEATLVDIESATF